MKRKIANTDTQADAVTYGVYAEKLAIEVAQTTSAKSKEELLGTVAQKLGAKRAMIVRGISSTEIEIEAMWPRKKETALGTVFQRFVAQRLSLVEDALQIVPAEEETVPDSRNILIHRLSSKRGDKNWNRAIVLAGRSFAPVKLSSGGGFLTFDFAITRVLATVLTQLERTQSDVPFSNVAFPLSAQAFLYWVLTEQLGPRIQVVCAAGTLFVRNVPLARETPDTSCELVAEKCLSYMAIGVPERIWLGERTKIDLAKGTTYEFDIMVGDMTVFGRRMTVRMSPSGLDAEVVIPMGWWWTDVPSNINVAPEKAQEIALNDVTRGGNGEVQAEYIQSHVWPEDPPHRVAHVVRISGEKKMAVTYFIDAEKGSIIRRRQAIRD